MDTDAFPALPHSSASHKKQRSASPKPIAFAPAAVDDVSTKIDDQDAGLALLAGELDLSELISEMLGTPPPSQPRPQHEKQKQNKAPRKVDIASEEAFPTLGGNDAPKSVFGAWANRKTLASVAPTTTAKSAKQPSKSSRTASGAQAAAGKQQAASRAPEATLPFSLNEATVLPEKVADLNRTLAGIAKAHTVKFSVNRNRPQKALIITVSGPKSELEIAKRKAVSLLSPRNTATISIPASMRGSVVGSKGSVISAIQNQTQTKIDVSRDVSTLPAQQEKNDAEAGSDDDEDQEPMVDIIITGDAEGIALAKEHIVAIVGDRVAKKTTKLHPDTVPPAMYPFLRGCCNGNPSLVQQIEAEHEVKILMPPPALAADDDASPYIAVQGEKSHVASAVAALIQHVDDIKRGTATLNLDLPKRQHRFVQGPRGCHLEALMVQTGCIVEIPSPESPATQLTIRGPSANLIPALQFVMEKANAVTVLDLDLTQYAADEQTAIVLARYLQTRDRAAVKDIEAKTGAQVVFPSPNAATATLLEISGTNPESLRDARTQLTAHLGTRGICYHTTAACPTELLKHQMVRRAIAKAREAAKASGMTLDTLYLNEGDVSDDLLVLVFAGADGQTKKKSNIAAVNALLSKTAQDLAAAGENAANFVTEKFHVATKYQKFLIGPKGATLKAIIAECNANPDVPLSVYVGNKGAKESSWNAKIGDDEVLLRGAQDDVRAARTKLKQIADEATHAEVMSGFTKEFEVPTKHVPHLVGKQGAQLEKLRDIMGIVKVHFEKPSNDALMTKVALQGTPKAVAECERRISEMVRQLEDFTTEQVRVPAEFHGKIIGEKGKYVKRLQDKYNVNIDFGSTGSSRNKNANDEGSPSRSPARRPANATADADIITVKGGRKEVKAVVAEILEVYEYEKSVSFTDTVAVPSPLVSSLIGAKGARIMHLKQLTGAKIDIPPASNDAESAEVTLSGTKDQVLLAKNVIRCFVKSMENSGFNWVTTTVAVPQELHRRLIGPEGANIRELLAPLDAASDPAVKSKPSKDEPSEQVRAILRSIQTFDGAKLGNANLPAHVRADLKFPKSGDQVVIKAADEELLARAKELLEQRVKQLQSEVKLCMHVPAAALPSLIGRGGEIVRELQQKYSVKIDMQRKTQPKDEPVPAPEDRPDLQLESDKMGSIYVTGSSDQVEACISDIWSRVPCTRTVTIPGVAKRRILSDGAIRVKKLRSLHDVQLDMPKRNTDDPNADEEWTVRGPAAGVEATIGELSKLAAEFVAKTERIDQPGASVPQDDFDTGFVLEIDDIDSKYHRHIIGRGGATINSIREQTGTRIDMPRGSHIITVRGANEEDVAEAERLIREIVERAMDK